MSNKYVTLTNSNNSFSRKFRVVSEGIIDSLEKKQDIQVSVEGELDISIGSIFKSWQYLFRVRYEENGDDGANDYGTLSDLRKLYKYNNPTGTPSNVLTLTDHYGSSYSVNFGGKFEPKPFATTLEGTEAWYWVEVVLMSIVEETEEEGSGS